MSASLAIAIKVGASLGGAMSAFGNLKGRMQTVAAVTSKLKADQRKLGEAIKAGATLPAPELARLNARFKEQERILGRLRASTRALGISQAAIAANEANRTQLRGKIMETAGLAYLASRPLKVGIEFEASMSKVQALTRLDKGSDEMKALTG
ncbi:hypothetical protein FACS1894154_08380 [Betaproteobacteria bacterium]|nr:hypothetical protein FACS1894154_08380 [Betaproteobacteria bacterium]GHU25877.1 hypothetical protein FACS189488_13630 [Betaproteobacteria bacterium]